LEQIISQCDSIAYIRENTDNLKVLYISDNIFKKTGYKPEDFYQERVYFRTIIHSDDLLRLNAEKIFLVNKKQTNGSAEYRIISKNGENIWFSDVFQVVYDEQGNILRFQGVLTDISAQKENEEKNIAQHHIIQLRNKALLQLNERLRLRTEELRIANVKLEESESKFKVICEQLQLGVLILQFGKIRYVNQSFANLTPFSREEIMNWDEFEYLNFIHRDDVELVKKTVLTLMHSNEKKEYQFEFKKVSVNHETSWYMHWSKIIQYEGEKAILVILQDITQQRKWQNALAESESRLKAKLDFILSTDKPETDFRVTDIIDLEQLQKIQDTFATSNRVASVITDINGIPITQPSNFSPVCKLMRNSIKGAEKCIGSDKLIGQQALNTLEPFSTHCQSCGFRSAGAPIIVGGKHIATWMIGQPSKGDISEQKIQQIAKENDIPFQKLMGAYHKMDVMNEEGLDKIVEFLWLLAKDISAMGYNNMVLARELEERKKMENALRESEELYRQLVQTSPDGIALVSLDGKMIYTSPNCKTLFGYPEDYSTDDLNIFSFIHPDYLDGAIANFQALIKNEGRNTAQYVLINKDKSLFTAEINSTIVNDYHGNPKAMISILRDISERKKVEEELINAKNKAEESDRLKSAFLANMSHEIRTPMNGIIGFANLLNESNTSEEERKEYVEIINQNGNLLLQLIDDILDIARLEAGQVKIVESPCNLKQILHEQLFLFKALLEKKNNNKLDLILKMPEQGVNSNVLIDNTRLKQILTNLLSNALKFTEEGKIEFGYSIDSDNMLLFYVKDTGIGLPSDKLEIIFDRFRQANESKMRKYRGTGLGLAISSNLIKLMGGRIWVESELGKGSLFQFTIPLKLCSSNAVSNEESVTAYNLKHFDWVNKHILVVEDEMDNFRFLHEMLKTTKANIHHAKNGREAIDFCQQNASVDIVLMDMRMPEINGYIATTEIKKMRKNLPVIAQSAYAMPNEITLCLEAGCDDYISKPIDHHKLLEKINQFLTRG
jgi:PAS domain S-box-containing protein